MTYEYKNPYGKTYKIQLYKTQYVTPKNTAVIAKYYDEEFEAWLPYGTLSVNISPLPEDCIALDDNNWYGVLDWVVENGIATDTGKILFSGFCTYPVVRLNEGVF
jgi:hypothetical protein